MEEMILIGSRNLGINNENTKYYWNPTQLAKAMADSLKS